MPTSVQGLKSNGRIGGLSQGAEDVFGAGRQGLRQLGVPSVREVFPALPLSPRTSCDA